MKGDYIIETIKNITIQVFGDEEETTAIAAVLNSAITDEDIEVNEIISINASLCIPDIQALEKIAVDMASAAKYSRFDIFGSTEEDTFTISYEFSVLKAYGCYGSHIIPLPEGLFTLEDLISDIEMWTKSVGVDNYYDLILKNMTEEEIRKHHAALFESNDEEEE